MSPKHMSRDELEAELHRVQAELEQLRVKARSDAVAARGEYAKRVAELEEYVKATRTKLGELL
jgi:ribosomal protein L29